MTRDEFEELRRRFGEDVAAWPAPYRQAALGMLRDAGGQPSDDDEALDRLILDAASMETDERRLTRQVLSRLDASRTQRPVARVLSGFLARPAAMTACAAALFVVLMVAGYQMAGLQDDSFDSDLLALANGVPLGGDLLAAPGDEAGEENAL
jgi:hypothetical protein